MKIKNFSEFNFKEVKNDIDLKACFTKTIKIYNSNEFIRRF